MLPSKRIWVSPPILHLSFFFFSIKRENIGEADTTALAIGTIFLAMVCYPEVQKEAQAELDSIEDFPSLPYSVRREGA